MPVALINRTVVHSNTDGTILVSLLLEANNGSEALGNLDSRTDLQFLLVHVFVLTGELSHVKRIIRPALGCSHGPLGEP